MSQQAVSVRELSKEFGPVKAVNGLTFDLEAGGIVALLGGNGAGKTTTIAMLLGLLLPTSGTVRALGVDMTRDRHRALGRMNFSSPYVELPGRLTAEENLLVYARLYGVARAKRRVRELAETLELTPLLAQRTRTLSAGEKSRLALAKALVNEPQLLLLDEPTASLDPGTADWVRGYLEAYVRRTGATILLASHNMVEVERICCNVLMMKDGRLVDRGAPDALIARYGRRTMEEVFLDVARGDGSRSLSAPARSPAAP